MDLFNILMVAAPAAMFVVFGGHRTVSSVVSSRYQRFMNLQRVVSFKHKGMATILYVSVYLLFQALMYTMMQKINKTVVRKENFYEVTYFMAGQKYKFTAPAKKGPCPVIAVLGDSNEDITDLVAPYFGPNDDFHGQQYTPAFFGQNEITFELEDLTQRYFKHDDVLHLKPDLEMTNFE